ncbi:MAG: tRNA lysidine(34) synthetase TilS [Bacteroidales bacterium]|nr:tRNA lysidine(34) synthetase TilS [Bacteroidales bacterium]
MLKKIKSFVEKHNLIEKDDRVLLAISGGVDSMVLAELLLRLQDYKTTRLQDYSELNGSKVQNLAFAHCNFHLRGEDSNRDEKFVTDFANENNVPIFIKHFDTEKYAKENSLSIEMAARELRYSWFKELKEIHNFNKVALAHHGDDQIETFFINFLRGSGIKGLKGMKPQNDFYIRPLLWSNRNEIETFAKDNDIQWVEDYTNQETVYLRNKIRHNIIPIFDEIKDNARQSLNFSINCLSSENDLYRSLIEEKISNIETSCTMPELVEDTTHGASTSSATAFPRSIENKYFLQDANGKQLLFEWVRRYGFNYDQAESMYEAMKNEKSGVVFYNDNIRLQDYKTTRLQASVQKDKIEIFEEKENDEVMLIETQRLKDAKTQSSDDGSVTLRLCDSVSLRLNSYNKDESFKLLKDPSVAAQFDMDRISFPLKLRHWRKGDKFRPLGMKGSKLLSDFFNDLGFSAYQKQNVWIMEDANGLILWVVGYRINDKVKILNSTKVIFQCDLEH